MNHRIDTVGQPDIHNTLMNVRHLSGILALDTAFFQVFMVCVKGQSSLRIIPYYQVKN